MDLEKLLFLGGIEKGSATVVIKNPGRYGGHLPLGKPISVGKDLYESSMSNPATFGRMIPSVNHFPFNGPARSGFETAMGVIAQDVVPANLPPIEEVTIYSEIKKFDELGDIAVALDTLRGCGCAVIKMPSAEETFYLIQHLEAMYKYNSFTAQIMDKYDIELEDEDDCLENYAYFFRPEYIIPVFNRRKIDGFGLTIRQFPRKNNLYGAHPNYRYAMSFVFSNYEDNFFIIDGSMVRRQRPIDPVLLKDLENRLLCKPRVKVKQVPEIKIKEHEKKIKSKKVKKKKVGDGPQEEEALLKKTEGPNQYVELAVKTQELDIQF